MAIKLCLLRERVALNIYNGLIYFMLHLLFDQQSTKEFLESSGGPYDFHENDTLIEYWYKQGRRHEVLTGNGDGFRLGGRIQVSQNHLLPNSDFSSYFTHLIHSGKNWKT